MGQLKRLYRSSKDRMIAGVCGGIAEYFGIDVVVVRLIWVLLGFMGGPAVFGYIIAWIVIPPEPSEPEQLTGRGETQRQTEAGSETDQRHGTRTGEIAIAALLICLGVVFLLRQFMPRHWLMWLAWSRWWPLLLVAAGAALLFKSSAK